MKGLMSSIVLIIGVLVSGCSTTGSTTAPSAVVRQPIRVSFDINLPDAAAVARLNMASPNGVALGPIEASIVYDYQNRYGVPNVYWGETAPPAGTYREMGIVVAPRRAAGARSFTGNDWPGFGERDQAYEWIGRFVYVPAR